MPIAVRLDYNSGGKRHEKRVVPTKSGKEKRARDKEQEKSDEQGHLRGRAKEIRSG